MRHCRNRSLKRGHTRSPILQLKESLSRRPRPFRIALSPKKHNYFPIAPVLLFLGSVITVALLLLFELHIFSFAFQRLGIPPRAVTFCLLGSLIGSAVNIPVARFESKNILNAKTVQFCGMRYYLPKINQRKETILAINLGGAIIPSGLSLYLIFNNALFTQAFIAISVVAILVNRIAFRVKGVGIAVPTIAPPIIALLTASLVAPESTAPVAYISGTLGTLIGADLMNLYGLDELSAPVVSIGGAGTSDGIFLTGIIAVLLA